ncbi:MAG: YcxB family protein [Clostridia bacterium]|nr:YcxB family protein [Clostridia bacterium]
MKSLASEGYVTPRDYNAYLKFNLLKGKYYRLKKVFVLISIALLCIALFLSGLSSGNKNYMVIAGIILLCTCMFFYSVNVAVKNNCNKNAKVIRAKQRTTFGKNGFVFELLFENEEENEYSEILFDEVEKIYLAPQAMYIYIEKRSVIVVPKRNLKVSPKEALTFLEKYCPNQKLVVCV